MDTHEPIQPLGFNEGDRKTLNQIEVHLVYLRQELQEHKVVANEHEHRLTVLEADRTARDAQDVQARNWWTHILSVAKVLLPGLLGFFAGRFRGNH